MLTQLDHKGGVTYLALSRKADYALRAMVELAAVPDGLIPTAELADRVGVPYAFMAKIVNELQARGLAEVRRGNKGGVRICGRAEDVTGLQVVEAVGGQMELNRCIGDPASCPRSSFCALRDMLAGAQAQLVDALSVDLRSLATAQERKLRSVG